MSKQDRVDNTPVVYFTDGTACINTAFFKGLDLRCLSPEYLELQCAIRGKKVGHPLFYGLLCGAIVSKDAYDTVLECIKRTSMFDEFLDDSRLVKFVQEVWIGLDPAVNSIFWFSETGKLMDRWHTIGRDYGWKWGHREDKKNTELKCRLYDAIFEKCPEVLKRYYDENVSQKMSEILDEEKDDFGMFQPVLQFFRMFKKKAASGDAKAKAMFEDMARQLVDCI
jgi:hypothetical protein